MVSEPAPGWFCTMTVGLPGMYFGRWRASSARVDVIARADADADHEAHDLALVEGGDVVLRLGRRDGGTSAQREQSFLMASAPRIVAVLMRRF